MTEPLQEPVAEEAAGDDVATADFKGQTFKLNPDVSEWAVLEFAAAADSGDDAGSFTGMAALHNFVVELVHPDDRARFRSLCRRERAGSEDLLEFMFGKKLEDAAERPTERSSDSSDGPTGTLPKSDANSGDKGSLPSGMDVLKGRPELQLMVLDAARRAS